MPNYLTIARGFPIAGYLLIALAVSLGFNAWQLKSKIVADAKAPLVKKIEVLEVTAAVTTKISELRVQHDKELQKLRDEADQRGTKREIVYETKVRTLPAPACAPGQARVNAWNETAGAKP